MSRMAQACHLTATQLLPTKRLAVVPFEKLQRHSGHVVLIRLLREFGEMNRVEGQSKQRGSVSYARTFREVSNSCLKLSQNKQICAVSNVNSISNACNICNVSRMIRVSNMRRTNAVREGHYTFNIKNRRYI